MDRRTVAIRRLIRFATIIALAVSSAAGAQEQSADKDKLAEVDRNFTCPESIPDDATRQAAVKQYILRVRDAWPDASVDDMIAYRTFLLKKHNCTKTLEAIQRQDR